MPTCKHECTQFVCSACQLEWKRLQEIEKAALEVFRHPISGHDNESDDAINGLRKVLELPIKGKR